MVGCYDPTPVGTGPSYRGVVAIDAPVSAVHLGWQTVTPSAAVDLQRFPVGTGTPAFNPWCPADLTLKCWSEDPVP
jgi:hypothetical protein